MKEVTFTPIVVSSSNWRVSLLYVGDGYSGKYSPAIDSDDEDEYHHSDQPIITLIVEQKIGKEWKQVKYGKQNTYLLVTDPINLIKKCASLIMKRIKAYNNWSNDDDNRRFFRDFGFVHLRKDKICFIEDLGYNSEDDS